MSGTGLDQEQRPATQGPMKLALVIEHFDPQTGGAERSTAEIATELAQRGHDVTILAGSSPEAVLLPGVTIRPFAERRSPSVARLLAFRRWAMGELAGGGFDASLSVTMAVPATVLQPRGGTVRETLDRNIALRHGAADRTIKRLLVRLNAKQQTLLALERRTLADPRVRRIVAISRYVLRQLQEHYAIEDGRIELVPNAAAMPQADDDQRRQWRQQVRSAFGVPQDAVAYLFAAQNPRLKGYEPLLRATRRLVERGQGPARNPVLLLAGGLWHDHHAMAVAAGLRDQVRFVRHTRHMPALYAAADVTVLPTFYDPASKVVIESLMMGTPAISTRYNGASDLIVPDDGPMRGRVIDDPWATDALAAAMAELADPAERRRCRDATAGLAESLSMARHVDRLEHVLRDATAMPDPAPATPHPV